MTRMLTWLRLYTKDHLSLVFQDGEEMGGMWVGRGRWVVGGRAGLCEVDYASFVVFRG